MGSEMCIRDRIYRSASTPTSHPTPSSSSPNPRVRSASSVARSSRLDRLRAGLTRANATRFERSLIRNRNRDSFRGTTVRAVSFASFAFARGARVRAFARARARARARVDGAEHCRARAFGIEFPNRGRRVILALDESRPVASGFLIMHTRTVAAAAPREGSVARVRGADLARASSDAFARARIDARERPKRPRGRATASTRKSGDARWNRDERTPNGRTRRIERATA